MLEYPQAININVPPNLSWTSDLAYREGQDQEELGMMAEPVGMNNTKSWIQYWRKKPADNPLPFSVTFASVLDCLYHADAHGMNYMHSLRCGKKLVRLARKSKDFIRDYCRETRYIFDYTEGDLLIAGMLHDIGKDGIDPKIWDDPGSLSWTIKNDFSSKHPLIGYHRLMGLMRRTDVTERKAYEASSIASLQHHEFWKGTYVNPMDDRERVGYPYMLRGLNIHPMGLLLLLIDVDDAMRSTRAYKQNMEDYMVGNSMRSQLLTTGAAHPSLADAYNDFIVNRDYVMPQGFAPEANEFAHIHPQIGLSVSRSSGIYSDYLMPDQVYNYIINNGYFGRTILC